MLDLVASMPICAVVELAVGRRRRIGVFPFGTMLGTTPAEQGKEAGSAKQGLAGWTRDAVQDAQGVKDMRRGNERVVRYSPEGELTDAIRSDG